MGTKLDREFFRQGTLQVAKKLLGKQLVVNSKNKKVGVIVETEAYIGKEDKACHAFKGKTKRNEVMWGKPGLVYVYLVYGIYYMLNIVTEQQGIPAAVLIRSLKPVEGIKGEVDGPGKLTKELGINRQDNGVDLVNSQEIYILDTGKNPKEIKQTTRVGVDYAGSWADKPWRFIVNNV
jgi:DNA-3-methyladenine glycosylase